MRLSRIGGIGQAAGGLATVLAVAASAAACGGPAGQSASAALPATSSAGTTLAGSPSPSTTSTGPSTTTGAAPSSGATTSTSAPPTSAAPTGARQAAATAAAAVATNAGWRTGIAIVDIQTGQATTAGDATTYFPAESTVKVLLAGHILVAGQMTGDVASAARLMIVASDDGAADELYDLGGGDDVTSWAETHYGIPGLGEPPANGAGQWGSTRVSPLGMASYLSAAANDPLVGPWLLGAMAQMQSVASDGTNQVFGIKAVAPTAAVKQGWGGDVPGMNAEATPSIGVVDGRYAVAIYTLHRPQASQSRSMQVVTQQAQVLLPGGHVPAL